MYTEEMLESIKKVEAKRAENAAMEPRRMTAEEKDQVLKENHPDYREDQFDVLSVGPNKLRTSRTTLRHSTSWTALAAVTLLRIRNWFTSWLPRLRTAFSGSRIWALSSTRTQKAT